MDKKQVTYTGDIPICPNCNKPTKRTGGSSMVTAAYYQPIYDENGNNTNPDRNTITSSWHCYECNSGYTTVGNYTDGFYYYQKENS